MRPSTSPIVFFALAGFALSCAFACRGNQQALIADTAAGAAEQTTASAGVGVTAGDGAGSPSSPASTPSAPGSTPASPSSGAAPSNYVFSPYKDVTVDMNYNTNEISTAVTGTTASVLTAMPTVPAVTWSFATGECGTENWAGIAPDALAKANVAAWDKAGVGYIVSTGGAAGSFTCTSDAGFNTFLGRYMSKSLLGVDFDIENGQSAADIANLVARVKAAAANPAYANLRFSFTIATLASANGDGLVGLGDTVAKAIAAGGLTKYTINLMVMDYGSASASTCVVGSTGQCDMGQSAIQAAKNLHSKYNVPYANIELTPMIGGNDSQGEVVALADVKAMMAFVKSAGISGVHFWALDRDRDCTQSFAADNCNSVGNVGTLGFLNAFLANHP